MIFRLTASTYIHMFWGKDHPHVDRHHRPISLSTALCMYRRLSHLIKVWLSLSSVDSLVFIKTNLMWWYRATESVMQCDGGGEFSSSAFSAHTHTHTQGWWWFNMPIINLDVAGTRKPPSTTHNLLYCWNAVTVEIPSPTDSLRGKKNLYRNHIRTNVN